VEAGRFHGVERHDEAVGRNNCASQVTRQALNNLVNGKAGISPEMAVRLSKAFGASPETWLQLQMAYDLAQVRRQKISVKRVARSALTDDLHP
jgi:plasmid maintenance system antidote protein VapI